MLYGVVTVSRHQRFRRTAYDLSQPLYDPCMIRQQAVAGEIRYVNKLF